jgi:DNA replication initiation complex subunit (GINS family)
LREEATRITEVGSTQTVEIEELITKETELIESVEKTITTSKDTLTSLRTKEKEINTKITTSSESSDVESYRRELTVITG